MIYHLLLPKGTITENRGAFVGSETHGIWSPYKPGSKSAPKGWQKGDQLIVSCEFNLYPNTTDLPPASAYYGLSVAAINNASVEQQKIVEKEMQRKSAGVVGEGVTESVFPAGCLFYKAVPLRTSIPLQPASRGTVNNIVYQWSMDYNADYPNVNPTAINIIFGYGDPMWDDEKT